MPGRRIWQRERSVGLSAMSRCVIRIKWAAAGGALSVFSEELTTQACGAPAGTLNKIRHHERCVASDRRDHRYPKH